MQVRITAYAGDCCVSGVTELTAGRLTDLLNGPAQIELQDAVLESLEDGHEVRRDRLELQRDELFAVEIDGPRGPQQRRIHTVRHRLQIQLGPYTVLGHLHTRPGAQATSAIQRRPAFVPLTAATIAFVAAGQARLRDVDGLLVNRDRAAWVSAAEGDVRLFAGLPAATSPGRF